MADLYAEYVNVNVNVKILTKCIEWRYSDNYKEDDNIWKLPDELGTIEKQVGAPIDTNYANSQEGRKTCGNPC